MTTLELKSKKREILGKAVKSLRREGVIPAVVYGGKDGATPIELDRKAFAKLFKAAGETTLVKLFIAAPEGGAAEGEPRNGREPRQGRDDKAKNVLIHDVSRDTMTDEITHADFYEVRMDEKITANIPLVFIGDAPAVSDLGGTLVKSLQELEVRALPADLPRQIDIDISQIGTFDDNILVGDIKLPKGVEVLENKETSVAAVAPPRSEAEMEALSGQVEEKVEEVAVETEEKVKERSEEKTEATE